MLPAIQCHQWSQSLGISPLKPQTLHQPQPAKYICFSIRWRSQTTKTLSWTWVLNPTLTFPEAWPGSFWFGPFKTSDSILTFWCLDLNLQHGNLHKNRGTPRMLWLATSSKQRWEQVKVRDKRARKQSNMRKQYISIYIYLNIYLYIYIYVYLLHKHV